VQINDSITKRQHAGAGAAFTLVDLFYTLAVLSVLCALVIVPWSRMKQKASLTTCSENLHQIGRALSLYCEDNRDTLPVGLSIPSVELWWSYKEQIKRYIPNSGLEVDKVFACPADRGYSDPQPFHKTARFAHGSYPYNGVTIGDVPNIAGWRLHEITAPQRTLLAMEWCAHAPLSWHKSRTGKRNLPFYGDAESMVVFVDGHAAFTKIYYDGYNAAYTRDPIPGYNYKYSGK
jgi:type II secretory pathway pseudopilin PulG